MKRIKRNILLNPGPSTTTDTVKCEQVVEIDTFDELKAIDKAYDVQKCP